jgi:hypothetical protein
VILIRTTSIALPPGHDHLALCCCKAAADKLGQHAAFEVMAMDQQLLVYAITAFGEQLQRTAALRHEP